MDGLAVLKEDACDFIISFGGDPRKMQQAVFL